MLIYQKTTQSLKIIGILSLLILVSSFISCHSDSQNTIEFISDTPVEISGIALDKNEEGRYVFSPKSSLPNLYSIKTNESEWELYWEPNKEVVVEITPNSIRFTSDLKHENDYLQRERQINESVITYLNNNWFQLHSLNQADFHKKVDSIRGLFISALEQESNLGETFRDFNAASVHFSMDRMILRYPRFHKNFTGKEVSVDNAYIEKSLNNFSEVNFLELDNYRKFGQTWIDLKTNEVLSNKEADSTMYSGFVRTNTTLDFIKSHIKNQELKEYWSLEYIKSHIEQYTWLNGKELLKDLAASAQNPKMKNRIEQFQAESLEKRKDLETLVYKTINGFQLEAYVFKPKDFDPNKTYPALAAFHGGGWVVGDASFTIESAQHAAENGLVGFSVEYRLSNRDDVTPADAMNDVRDFFVWLRKNASSFSIDPSKIIGKGLSAGGHLVSSISVIQREKESVPNAMILISPALDTSDGYFKSLLSKGENASDLSPVENLKKGLDIPPTLLLQGRTDNLTPTKYAEQFHKQMNELEYSCDLVIYEGCGHLFTPSHLDDTAWPQSDPEIVKKAFEKQKEFYQSLGY